MEQDNKSVSNAEKNIELNDKNEPVEPEKKGSPHTLLLAMLILLIVGIAGAFAAKYYLNIKNDKTPTPTPIVEVPITQNKDIKTIAEGNDFFGMTLLQSLNEKDKNIFISPLSISMILDLVANGARSETKSEMLTTLGMGNFTLDDINSFNHDLIKSLTSDKDKELSIANSIWIQKDLSVLDTYKKLAKDSYSAESKNLDFKQASSADTINDWIADKTRGRIKNMVDPDMIKDMKVILANAIYFKANWKDAFDESATRQEDFTLQDDTKIKQYLMNRTDSFSYFEDKDNQIVKLPYKDENLDMFVFLPAKGSDIDKYVNGLDWKELNETFSKLESKEGHLALPKFKIEYDKTLNDQLKTLGMVLPFNCSDNSKVDFSNISITDKLCISLVKHKSFLEVTEKGTEAAAATIIGQKVTSININEAKPFEMIVDRPFFLLIRDNQSKVNLFSGVIKNPQQ